MESWPTALLQFLSGPGLAAAAVAGVVAAALSFFAALAANELGARAQRTAEQSAAEAQRATNLEISKVQAVAQVKIAQISADLSEARLKLDEAGLLHKLTAAQTAALEKAFKGYHTAHTFFVAGADDPSAKMIAVQIVTALVKAGALTPDHAQPGTMPMDKRYDEQLVVGYGPDVPKRDAQQLSRMLRSAHLTVTIDPFTSSDTTDPSQRQFLTIGVPQKAPPRYGR